MNQKILFVDDEPNVLAGFERQLRKRFTLSTALSGEEGLRKAQAEGPFAVIVSDMRMPGMNGAEFLSRVRDRSPDTVRMILTGQADLDSTIRAVNEGSIFRFLTKPCPIEELTRGVEAALEQNRLILAEREILEQTLAGSVRALTEVLELVNPSAFSRGSRVQQYAEQIADALGLADRWELRLAALLSQIGCIAVPTETLAKLYADQPLTDEEQRMIDGHPDVAARLLGGIPRLERVARIIARQRETGDGDGTAPAVPEDPERLAAQVLRAAIEYDRLIGRGAPHARALAELKAPGRRHAARLVQALEALKAPCDTPEVRAVAVSQLTVSMILDEDVRTTSGLLLVSKGQQVTDTMIARLRNFAKGVGVVEPFRVRVP